MSDPVASNSHRAGFWNSWVTPELVAGRIVGLSELCATAERLYWLESRPQEKRTVIVSCGCEADAEPMDILPTPRDVGTSVHEYGGGAYAVAPDGRIVMSDRRENDVWLRDVPGHWRRLSGSPGCRYADFAFESIGSGIFCVREAHGESGAEPIASIVWIGLDGVEHVLASGDDFYAAPRPSPDGRFLAWIAWSHPNMPWDATHLHVATLSYQDGIPIPCAARVLHDGSAPRSIIEPVWQTDGTLLANSDAQIGWRPVRFDPRQEWQAEYLPDPGVEVGLPHWVFGQRTLSPLPDGRLLSLGIRDGINEVLMLDGKVWHPVALGAPTNCPLPFGDGYAWIDAPADRPAAIVAGRPGTRPRTIQTALHLPAAVAAADIAVPEPMTFPTAGGGTGFALFYAPAAAHETLASTEKPPLVVMAHGGPTGRANPAFSFKVQWWTSRGFAVLDVNYRGSTGFGRAYREALNGLWGVADVEDCIHAVQHTLALGWADPARVVIRGSSAGGLTVLQCLAESRLFAAGTSLYGVTDLRALARETHKFEARYLDRLIGPYPEAESIYLERSPITHAAKIEAPVLFLHGNQDQVVPLSQAEEMAKSLRERGNHVGIHLYLGEGHGFRQQETLMDSFARELAFYQAVFKAAE